MLGVDVKLLPGRGNQAAGGLRFKLALRLALRLLGLRLKVGS